MGNIASLQGTYELQLGHTTIGGPLPDGQSITFLFNNAGQGLAYIVNGMFEIDVDLRHYLEETHDIKLKLDLNPDAYSGQIIDSTANYGSGNISVFNNKHDKSMDCHLFIESDTVVSDSNIVFTLAGKANKDITLKHSKIKIAYTVQFLHN